MDHYYKIGNHNIHMMQLAISIGIVMVSALVVFFILGSFLRKDFSLIELAVQESKEKKAARAKSA